MQNVGYVDREYTFLKKSKKYDHYYCWLCCNMYYNYEYHYNRMFVVKLLKTMN